MESVVHNEPRTTIAIYTHVTDEWKKKFLMLLIALSNLFLQNKKEPHRKDLLQSMWLFPHKYNNLLIIIFKW